MARFIAEGKISIFDIMSEEKIIELNKIFENFPASLSEAKEIAGVDYSFGELRIYKGYRETEDE